MTHSCQRCGREWKSSLEDPKACRWCGSKLWRTARTNAPGQGRPKGAQTANRGKEEVEDAVDSPRFDPRDVTGHSGKSGSVPMVRGKLPVVPGREAPVGEVTYEPMEDLIGPVEPVKSRKIPDGPVKSDPVLDYSESQEWRKGRRKP